MKKAGTEVPVFFSGELRIVVSPVETIQMYPPDLAVARPPPFRQGGALDAVVVVGVGAYDDP